MDIKSASIHLTVVLAIYGGMCTCVIADERTTNTQDRASYCPSQCSCGPQQKVIRCATESYVRIPILPQNTSELYMIGNFLGPVVNGSISTLRHLEILDLSNNNIRSIQPDFLNGLAKLKNLRLSRNSLDSLPDDLFSSTSGLQSLNLSRNHFYILPEKCFRHLPHLKKLDLSRNNLISPHLGIRYQVLTRLNILDLSHNNFETIPAGSFEVISRWDAGVPKYINLSYSNICVVEHEAFSSIRGLYEINIAGNPGINKENLSLILSELQNSGIKKLDISNMNITDLKTVLRNFTVASLEELDLSQNLIINVPDNSFNFMVSLKKLDLSHNEIVSLTGGLKLLSNLEALDVSNNKISTINGEPITRLINLITLNLSGNKIQQVVDSTFAELSHLQALDLSENRIRSYDLSKTVLVELKHLNLARNKLPTLGSSVNIPKLQTLDLSGNKMTQLKAFLLRNCRDIRFVNFSGNQIIYVNHQVFKPNIPEVIDLSYNYLHTIKNFAWMDATHIHLQGNLIQEIDYQAFYAMNNLIFLDLSQNQIRYISKNTFTYLTNLTRLLLNNNNLRLDPNKVSIFRNLESLEFLDLDNNMISKIKSTVFKRCQKLVELSLASNAISTLDPDVLGNLPNLKRLNLVDNPFTCSCDLVYFKRWLYVTSVTLVLPPNQNLVCKSPPGRKGEPIKDFIVSEFECNHLLIYLVIICSLIGLAMLVCVMGTFVCHYFNKWRQDYNETELDDRVDFDDEMGLDAKENARQSIYEPHDKTDLIPVNNSILKGMERNGYIGSPPKEKNHVMNVKDKPKSMPRAKAKLKNKKLRHKRSNSVTFGIPLSRTADYIMHANNYVDIPRPYGTLDPRIHRSRSLNFGNLEDYYLPSHKPRNVEEFYALPRKYRNADDFYTLPRKYRTAEDFDTLPRKYRNAEDFYTLPRKLRNAEDFYTLPCKPRRNRNLNSQTAYPETRKRRYHTLNGDLRDPVYIPRRRRSVNSDSFYVPISYDDHRHTADVYRTLSRQRQPINPALGDYLDLPLLMYRRRPSNHGNSPILKHRPSATLPRNIGRPQSMSQIPNFVSPRRKPTSVSSANGVHSSRVRRSESNSRIQWV